MTFHKLIRTDPPLAGHVPHRPDDRQHHRHRHRQRHGLARPTCRSLPLFLLMFSGLYMFVLPYLAKSRRTGDEA